MQLLAALAAPVAIEMATGATRATTRDLELSGLCCILVFVALDSGSYQHSNRGCLF